jgi:hypothetical protein
MHGEMSNKIRVYAEREYVSPARRSGRRRFTIPVRDVLNTMVEREGLPRQNVPQVCQALRSPRKFLDPLGLEIEKVDGPEKQTSTTVVFHYRFRHEPGAEAPGATTETTKDRARVSGNESPLARLRGLLREELAAYGGGEAFLKWLRTDAEKDRR